MLALAAWLFGQLSHPSGTSPALGTGSGTLSKYDAPCPPDVAALAEVVTALPITNVRFAGPDAAKVLTGNADIGMVTRIFRI